MKHTNVVCICSEERWKQKVDKYMEQTDIFSLVGDMPSDTAPNDVEHVSDEDEQSSRSNSTSFIVSTSNHQ